MNYWLKHWCGTKIVRIMLMIVFGTLVSTETVLCVAQCESAFPAQASGQSASIVTRITGKTVKLDMQSNDTDDITNSSRSKKRKKRRRREQI